MINPISEIPGAVAKVPLVGQSYAGGVSGESECRILAHDPFDVDALDGRHRVEVYQGVKPAVGLSVEYQVDAVPARVGDGKAHRVSTGAMGVEGAVAQVDGGGADIDVFPICSLAADDPMAVAVVSHLHRDGIVDEPPNSTGVTGIA